VHLVERDFVAHRAQDILKIGQELSRLFCVVAMPAQLLNPRALLCNALLGLGDVTVRNSLSMFRPNVPPRAADFPKSSREVTWRQLRLGAGHRQPQNGPW
jgi:hypothetical protein